MTVEEIKDMVRSAPGITEFQRRVYLALLDVPKERLADMLSVSKSN